MAVAKKMESTWRWYGPKDPITLADIKQTNATGIVTALHEVPNGEVWTVEAIMERKKMVEDAGMVWSVIESIPIHEDIKRRVGDYEKYFENYRQSLRNAAACGIDTVCYNFMPIIDWTRTSLRWPLGDGALALAFDYELMVAFDAYILARPDKAAIYSEHKRHVARDNPYDIFGYMDGKDALVKQLQAEALAWRAAQENGR